jgi:hypothetical protein
MATYKIVCKHFDMSHPDHNKRIASGLTLEQAQACCSSERTHGDGWAYFYYEENRAPKPPSKLEKLCMLQTRNPAIYFGC